MERIWEFTGETKVSLGITLRRIKLSVTCKWGSEGNLGGWIEKESNLYGNAWVSGNAEVSGDARVYGNARVSGDARVYGNAWVYGDARVSGDARVYGNAWVYGDARVSGNAEVYGNARVSGDAWVSGNAEVSGDARVSGNAVSNKKVFTLNFGYLLTLTDKHIKYGCEQRTIEKWEEFLNSEEVIETQRDTPEFKILEMSLKLAIEQHKQLK